MQLLRYSKRCSSRSRRDSYTSCAAVSDDKLPVFDYDRHLPAAAGKFQHLVHPRSIGFNIVILRPVPIGRPGLTGVGSARFAVNDNLRHGRSPFPGYDRAQSARRAYHGQRLPRSRGKDSRYTRHPLKSSPYGSEMQCPERAKSPHRSHSEPSRIKLNQNYTCRASIMAVNLCSF